MPVHRISVLLLSPKLGSIHPDPSFNTFTLMWLTSSLLYVVHVISHQVALSLETYGLTVEAQQMYLDLIAREQSGSGTAHVSQDELETWEVSWADLDCLQTMFLLISVAISKQHGLVGATGFEMGACASGVNDRFDF